MYTLLPIVITDKKQIELPIQTPYGFIFIGLENGHVSYVRDQRIQKKYQLRLYIEDEWIQKHLKQLKDLSFHVHVLSLIEKENIHLSFLHDHVFSPPFHQQVYFTLFPSELVCFFKITNTHFYIKYEYQDICIDALFSDSLHTYLTRHIEKRLHFHSP